MLLEPQILGANMFSSIQFDLYGTFNLSQSIFTEIYNFQINFYF